jgi:hypothetical protein
LTTEFTRSAFERLRDRAIMWGRGPGDRLPRRPRIREVGDALGAADATPPETRTLAELADRLRLAAAHDA